MLNYTPHQTCLDGIESLLGNTPLIKLKALFPSANVYAKLECYNPSGSIKDRPIALMIQRAIEENKIQPGSTLIIPTSGNTGIGACIFGKQYGLKCICVLPDDVPLEKIHLLNAYGAKVILCKFQNKSDEEGGYVRTALELSKKLSNSLLLDQFKDELNPLAHYLSTGPEIWDQMRGKIDYFFCGMGSGGTISGIGKFLKEQNPDIQVIGIEPKGGVNKHAFYNSPYLSEDHLIAGVSDNFISPNINFDYIDDVIEIDDKRALQRCNDLIYAEAIFAGSSSGLAIEGVQQFIAQNQSISFEDLNIITVFPDSGTRYQHSLLNPSYHHQMGNSFLSYDHPEKKALLEYIKSNQDSITRAFL